MMTLNEINSESLQDLLSAVRTDAPPLILGPFSLTRGDVVEIQGPSSSGKTHVLYHILVASLLSSPSSAIVYDTDHSFSLPRLRSILTARIAQDAPSISLAHHVGACLKRVHVFTPSSSLQLAASIRALPSYHARVIPHSDIGLVIIDSLSAFYWSDRFAAEEYRAVPLAVESKNDGGKGRVDRRLDTVPIHAVLTSLQRLRSSHRPVVVYTNWALNPIADPSLDNMAYRQHLHFLSPHISSLLPLAYHITLPLAPFHPHSRPSVAPPMTAGSDEEQPMVDIDETDGKNVLCLLRIPGRSDIQRFTFRISHDDVIF